MKDIENFELYKDIPGYEGFYQVSNFGNVKSISRKIKNNKGFYISKEIKMKQSLRDGFYLSVTLFKNGKPKFFRTHILVAMTFLDYKPMKGKIVVDHKNNNKKDNRVSNLQIISIRLNSSKDRKNKSSNLNGVQLTPDGLKWAAYIEINSKSIYLGRFNDKLEASNQYQKALLRISDFINPKQFRKIL